MFRVILRLCEYFEHFLQHVTPTFGFQKKNRHLMIISRLINSESDHKSKDHSRDEEHIDDMIVRVLNKIERVLDNL